MRKTTVVFYCDRCGKKIEGGHYRIKPHYYDEEDKERMSDLLIESLDREFCETCVREIMTGTSQSAVPGKKGRPRKKPERVIEKNKCQARRLDDGKIYALRNAGWDWDKIKSELYTDESIEVLQGHYEAEKKRRDVLCAAVERNLAAWDEEDEEDA